MNKNFKIFIILKIIFICFVFFKSYAENVESHKNKVTLGLDTAVVKIKVFSSHTCPHCANFHLDIIPKIKNKYVDSGKVQIIFIDFPLDQAAFNASKLLHCVEQKNQINFLDKIYKEQKSWTAGSDLDGINKNLKKIAKNLGISSLNFDQCLIDDSISDKILNERIDAQKKYSITATPTIIINEKKFEDSFTFENIAKKIDKII